MRCLAKAPPTRYARGYDLADALIAFLAATPDAAPAFRAASAARRSRLSSGA
jgi:hypothetical protein